MLTVEERMEIAVLRKHGASIHGIAKSLGVSRNTVRRHLREGEAAGVRKPGPKRPEKLDPFKDYIAARMKAAAPDVIPAAVLLREIEARGYEGGYTRLKVFVRGLRPLRLTMTHYGTVSPWREEVAANPLEGTALDGEEAFRIDYPLTQDGRPDPAGKPVIEGVIYPAGKKVGATRRFVAPVRLRHLIWLPPLAALWLADLPTIGTPHLRLTASYADVAGQRFYRRCDYAGLHSRTVHPGDGRCPLVLFLPPN